jgi:phage baseplate assembly protein W
MSKFSLDLSLESALHPKGKENLSYTFKDIGTDNFRYKTDNITGSEKVVVVNNSNVDMNAIKTSLRNILSFKNGEQPLDPTFGISKVYEMLYMPFDKYTTQKMVNTIKGIIASYEPRIMITSMPAVYDDDKNEFLITINYIVPKLNKSDSYVVTLTK